MVLAPVVRMKKGYHRDVLEKLAANGFVRARANGQIVLLEDVRRTAYQFLGKTVQADHRTDVQVIVPFDEGVIPHSA